MAAYGTIHAMVFPILMFPAAIIFSLSELLIPELGLAFCAAPEDAPCPLPDVIPLGAPSAGNPGAELRCALYREAAGHLRRAKEYHDLLEAGFAPFVDFSIADRAALDCCAELEVLADHAARG